MQNTPKPYSLPILLETEYFIAIDKPEGLSVHNETPDTPSVLTLLDLRLHLVNRLDKDTSGIVLLAKTSQGAADLLHSISTHGALKKYTAVLRGSWRGTNNQCSWTWPLTDKAEGRKSPQGKGADRKPCSTRIEVVSSTKYFTTIEAWLETGRQHQIRKHAALAGQAIVGDPRYNDPKYNSQMSARFGFSRMLLHSLSFEFKFRNQDFKLEAKVPKEFNLLNPERDKTTT